MASNLLRRIPSVDKIKTSEVMQALIETHGEEQVSEAVRTVLEALRTEIQDATDAELPEDYSEFLK